MKGLTEYLHWQVRIWLVRFGARCHERVVRFHVQTKWKDESESGFARYVDRVSPWITNTGYKRGWLRRTLYKIRYPRWFIRRFTFETLERLTYRPRFGRYEGQSDPADALKAEWLDTHSEYATDTTGDSDTYIWAALFQSFDVPWSRKPETWLVIVDTHGFVDVEEGGANVEQRFAEIAEEFAFDPDYTDAFEPMPSWFPEGDPTRNGAFG